MSYHDFIARKTETTQTRGLPQESISIGAHLFDFQRDLVRWALRRGSAAIFADTGLGKTAMQLEWARNVSEHGRVLILTPLAVAAQTAKEGQRFGVECHYRREDAGDRITIANYDMLDRFDPAAFAGIVLDESSILKSYDGATRTALIEAFAATPYRLACTATPSPNDYTELGNHSEFLGIKRRVEMLAEYFVHDGETTSEWRLKGHAQQPFWRWVSSWGAIVRSPSDLGYDGSTFSLPPLNMREMVLRVDHTEAWSAGTLFAGEAATLSDQRALRRATITSRVNAAAEIALQPGPCLIWCELNDEGDALEKTIPDSVQVRGSDDVDDKEDRLLGFAAGKYRVLITKPSIAGFGMNWQHCNRMVFAGASHSYEQTYQAIRRCWRFGQKQPVDVTVIRSESDARIMENYKRKSADAERMADEAAVYVAPSVRGSIGASVREWNEYVPTKPMRVPHWVQSEAA
jgi:superfamily II DNA or RNA helicase